MTKTQKIEEDILTGSTEHHLVSVGAHNQQSMLIHELVLDPFCRLRADAEKQGFDLCICSGFRSYERQLAIWNGKLSGNRPVYDQSGNLLKLNQLNDWEKVQAVLRWSAMPGASRHHWGTDIDIFDANAMTEGYQIQLTPEECEGQGLFAPMHQWLTGALANGEQNTYGFFQPYATDKGGVAPERWHLSYGPIAKIYGEQLSKSIIRQKLSRDANLMYLDVVLDHLDEIFERFVQI